MEKCKCGRLKGEHHDFIWCPNNANKHFTPEDICDWLAIDGKEKRCGKLFHFNHPIYSWMHLECGKWKEIKPNLMTMELCPSCSNHASDKTSESLGSIPTRRVLSSEDKTEDKEPDACGDNSKQGTRNPSGSTLNFEEQLKNQFAEATGHKFEEMVELEFDKWKKQFIKKLKEIPSIRDDVGRGCNNKEEMETFRVGYKGGRDVFKMEIDTLLGNLK